VPVIKFCENNRGKGTVIRRLREQHPGIDVTVEKCLGGCRSCETQLIATIDGRLVRGTDADDLYGRIVEALAGEPSST
jgi:uncharacterized protein YuzB (UPF0349 family)